MSPENIYTKKNVKEGGPVQNAEPRFQIRPYQEPKPPAFTSQTWLKKSAASIFDGRSQRGGSVRRGVRNLLGPLPSTYICIDLFPSQGISVENLKAAQKYRMRVWHSIDVYDLNNGLE